MLAKCFRRSLPVVAILTAIIGSSEPVAAQVIRSATGTFQTNLRNGSFKFVTVKAVRVGNTTALQGNFNIAGRSFPGVMFPTVDGRMSLAWYYGSTGITAGQSVAAKQADGTFSGPISFVNRNGTLTEQGTLTFKLGF